MKTDSEIFIAIDPPKTIPIHPNTCPLCAGFGTVNAEVIGKQDISIGGISMQCPICSGRGYID